MRTKKLLGCVCVCLFLLFSLSVEAKDKKLKERVAALEEQTAHLTAELDLLESRVSELEPEGFDEFKERLSNLESAFGHWDTTVNCGEGERLQEALDQAVHRIGSVTITVEGMCSESVVIRRDDVTLRGGSPGSGIQAPFSPEFDVLVTVEGAQRVTLQDFDLVNGEIGLEAKGAGSFSASNLNIEGPFGVGVRVDKNATGELYSSDIHLNPQIGWGIEVTMGGSLRVFGGTISDGGFGVVAHLGGSVELDGVTVDGFQVGLWVPGGTARLANAIVQNCGDAGIIEGQISVSASEIAGNGYGLLFEPGSNATVGGQTEIQDIGGRGNSSIKMIDTTITGSVTARTDTSLLFNDRTVVLGRVTLGDTSVLEASGDDPTSIQIAELYCDEEIVTQVMLYGPIQVGEIIGCKVNN